VSLNSRSLSKRVSVVASVAIIALFSSLAPANAVTPGGKCSPVDAKRKIGKANFTCADNPVTKSKAIVWVWNDCLAADAAYRKSATSQEELAETVAQTITMLRADIEKLRVEIAGKEAEAKTWDAKVAESKAKAATATAKAAELKANAAKGGITSITSGWKANLQVALLDGKLSSAEVTQLATAWATTADKVPFIIEFIAAEDQLRAARSHELAARNSERKAASLRSTDLIKLKERQIASAETNLSLGASQVDSLKDTRGTACSLRVWKLMI